MDLLSNKLAENKICRLIVVAKRSTEETYYSSDYQCAMACLAFVRQNVVVYNLQARRREILRVACMIHNTPKVKIPILRSLLPVGDTHTQNSQSFCNSG